MSLEATGIVGAVVFILLGLALGYILWGVEVDRSVHDTDDDEEETD